jgi:hypothetical protein
MFRSLRGRLIILLALLVETSPTGGAIDSQSVKAPEAKTGGYDAGKKIVGRRGERNDSFADDHATL